MRRRLFGFDTREVNETLEKREREHRDRTAALQAAVQLKILEEQKLQEAVRRVEERLKHKRALEERLEALPLRSGMIMPAMNEAVNKVVKELDAAAETEKQALIQQINRLDDRYNEIKKAMLQYLEQAGNLAAAAANEPVRKVLPFRAAPDREELTAPATPAEPENRAEPAEPVKHRLSFCRPHQKNPGSPDEESSWRPGSLGEESVQDQGVSASDPPTPAPLEAAQPRRPEPNPISSGLRERADSNMMKFLSGKVLGQDLRGSSGDLIASKGSLITAELAERAQNEGALSDLILHMTWPEESDP